MSGAGSPNLSPAETVDGSGLKITIVAGRWHDTIASGLLAGAHRVLDSSGAEITELRVPGSFELPVACKAALEAGADAVVALGVIIRGGTPHFDFVSNAATDGLTRVAIDTGKPVGFGVLTLDVEQQGIDRAGLPGSKEDKGAEAALAALEMAVLLRQLRGSA
ncbi:MAG: 6,7-dimethyl-8-ribityllumazine synthase [Salinibacterium sp.]|nr:6,7-dimethyl-8-ribityllumazine synthase [Micrococcales bacterium]MBX3078618.1 6,7-dimethyl-8-ribityllumazine synthase [Cryobacterium sp.]MCB1280177.1 6,7-dimethyl-8-ribityllumazine synthase [Salinibacterium sp.]